MKIIHFNEQMPPQTRPAMATIGFFDGVHTGHRFLIDELARQAHAEKMDAMVVTFDRHPREVLHSDYQPRLLSSLDEKLELMARTEADACAVLAFTPEMAARSAFDFMRTVLRDKLCVKRLFIGYDNRFGHNRSEGFADYLAYGRRLHIDVKESTAFTLGDIRVSSSAIRSLLNEGDVIMSNHCLGYAYTLSGTVVGGFREGRKIGFPTANLHPFDARKLIPHDGVYAVEATVEGFDRAMPAMMNIGRRPTYGSFDRSLEVHILDFHADIYDRKMSVAFIQRLRDEQTFADPAALAAQLTRDEAATRALLT